MVHAVNFRVLQLVSCMFLGACRTYYRMLCIFLHVALHSVCCINFRLLHFEG